jgi:SAM-dependent methyltransferase
VDTIMSRTQNVETIQAGSPTSPVRRANKGSIPAAPYSFSAVSVSFLAFNVKAATAIKVFEEALRILRPGGHVYLVDYDGRTVNKLPADWRKLLTRVDQFDPEEMQRHGMQEEEIRKILSCVGNRSTRCLDQGYSMARWVGVLPPDFSLY